MKTFGSTRRLDKLGRIVVPIELRRKLEWKSGTELEISSFGHYIFLRLFNDKTPIYSPEEVGNPMVLKAIDLVQKLSDVDLLLVIDIINRLENSNCSI